MARHKIGDRLRVNIRNAEAWTVDGLKGLQGRDGVVAEVLTHERMTQYPKREPVYLIRFDPPLAPLWKWGSQVGAHWFDESDLETVVP